MSRMIFPFLALAGFLTASVAQAQTAEEKTSPGIPAAEILPAPLPLDEMTSGYFVGGLAPLPMPLVSYREAKPQPSPWNQPVTPAQMATAVELDIRMYERHRPAENAVPASSTDVLLVGFTPPSSTAPVTATGEMSVVSQRECGNLLRRFHHDASYDLLASSRLKFLRGRPGQVWRGWQCMEPAENPELVQAGQFAVESNGKRVLYEAKTQSRLIGTALQVTVQEESDSGLKLAIGLDNTRKSFSKDPLQAARIYHAAVATHAVLQPGDAWVFQGFPEERTVVKEQAKETYTVSLPGFGKLPPVNVATTRREQEMVELVVLITPVTVAAEK